jgi:hypothetical protein
MITINRGVRMLTLAATVTLGSFALSGPVSAAVADPSPAQTAQSPAEPDAQPALRYCLYGSEAIAKENIKIRTEPKLDATALGLVLKNKRFRCHGGLDGERYTKCGKTSVVWQKITYKDMTGYIPGTCTKPAQ